MTNREEIRKNSLTIPMSAELKSFVAAEAADKEVTMATLVRTLIRKEYDKKRRNKK